MCHLTYNERSRNHPNPVVRKLFTLMDSKKTNLAVAADVTCKDRLMDLAEKLGPEICILKVLDLFMSISSFRFSNDGIRHRANLSPARINTTEIT